MSSFYGTEPINIAKRIVHDYQYEDLFPGEPNEPLDFEVKIVWFCYILGGWKALVCTDLPDLKYYELTYDKNRKKVYFDVYEKVQNQEIDL